MSDMDDYTYMRAALEEANAACLRGEVPIGAVLMERHSGKIVARNGNRTRAMNDPSAHAEMLVIRQVCADIGAQRIPDYDLYVTLEPCTMCAAAISFARIGRVVFGAADEKGGGITSGARFYEQRTCHHRPLVSGGIMAQECGAVLQDFFRARRGG